MQGTDHRQSRYASGKNDGFICAEFGERRWGYGSRLKSFSPWYLAKDNFVYNDRLFRISWHDLSAQEWTFWFHLGSNQSREWAYHLVKVVLKARKSCRRLQELLKEVRLARDDVPSKLLGDVPTKFLAHWERALEQTISSNLFGNPGDKSVIDIVRLLREPGVLVVLNFHGDDGGAETALYVGVLLRQIYQSYKRELDELLQFGFHARPNTPFIVVEEMNLLTPAKPGVFETPAERWIRFLVRQAQKVFILLVLIFQDAHDINAKTRRVLFGEGIFVSNPTAKDLKTLAETYPRDLVEVMKNLDITVREWCYVFQKNIFPFVPYASEVGFQVR